MVDGVRERELRRQIRQLLAKLELMPHGSTQSFDSAGRNGFGSTVGKLPGGISWPDDSSAPGNDHPQRSHEYFWRRYRGARSVAALEAILSDLEETIRAWRRTPPPSGLEPEFGTFAWKRMIANSEDHPAKLAERWRVSRAYIYKLRTELRDAA
jgi:hypothetical protein